MKKINLNYWTFLIIMAMYYVLYLAFARSVDIHITLTGHLCVILWSLCFGFLFSVLPKRLSVVLAPFFWLCNVFMFFAQYCYYNIFHSFFMLQSIFLAGEGADYIDVLPQYIGFKAALVYSFGAVIGTILLVRLMLHKEITEQKRDKIYACTGLLLSILCLICVNQKIITTFKANADEKKWNAATQPYNIYTHATNPYNISELTCYYQYLQQFIVRQISLHSGKQYKENISITDDYFTNQPKPAANDMTGILKGKNVILVMMESMDDWMINEMNTPTILYMEEHGINFTNFYTSIYGSGRTYNTEFCLMSGLYAPTNGVPASNYSNNTFKYSLAGLMVADGYSANEYHKSSPDYYNRKEMCKALGLQSFVSLQDYDKDSKMDTVISNNDTIYNMLIDEKPFLDYIITYTPHMKYTYDNPRTVEAMKQYPQYRTLSDSEELNSIQAKAKITDDMFATLLERLKDDHLLDDTVIIGVSDHYAYGLSDAGLKRVTGTTDINLNSKNVCFMYGGGLTSQTVTKTANTADLVPTMLNMLGIPYGKHYIGHDIFDPDYAGYAFFESGGWVTKDCYYNDNSIQQQFSDHKMSEQEIEKMNQISAQAIEANTAMIESNYYGNK